MFFFYFVALIPICAIALSLLVSHKINVYEVLCAAIIAIITAGAFHYWALRSQLGDYETQSGQIVQVRQFSSWIEKYDEPIYKTEYYTTTESYYSNGKSRTRTVRKSRRVFSHWEPRTRTHPEHWKAYSNIETEYNISKSRYIDLTKKFGGDKPIAGDRRTSEHNSRMIGGDPNDWIANNVTGYIEPVNKSAYFENRVRATKNIFNRKKVSKIEVKSMGLFEYPYHNDPWTSNRLLGTAAQDIDARAWEELNAVLGPYKKINLIAVGFESADSQVADFQIAHWKGPKKNDFIICYGPNWARVYSWSESELAKSNVETLFLNKNKNEILEKLEKEIVDNYTLVDWSKFRYLQINPQIHHVLWYLLAVFAIQLSLFLFFHYNEFNRE